MPLCASCQSQPADFDSYLCQGCAKSMGINSTNVHMAYGGIFNLFKQLAKNALVKPNGEALAVDLLYAAPAVNFHNARRLNYFSRLLSKVREMDGAIVECGVGGGQTLSYLATLAYDSDIRRKVWGFDSFIGPQVYSEGDTLLSQPDKMFRERREAQNYEANVKDCIERLTGYGIPPIWVNSNIALIAGFFEDTLPHYDGEPVALLHLDCNYYASYKTCLEYFYRLMKFDGVIAIDDYGSSFDSRHFPGCYRAVSEFCDKYGEHLIRDAAYGKYHIVVGRNGDD